MICGLMGVSLDFLSSSHRTTWYSDPWSGVELVLKYIQASVLLLEKTWWVDTLVHG